MTRGAAFHAICVLLACLMLVGPVACRNPAQSTLPPSAIGPGGTLPPLPKGDVYADETAAGPETLIEPGDGLEIIIRRGAGEEKYATLVRDTGQAPVAFLTIEVAGLSVSQAESRIQQKFSAYMRNPSVQILLKKKSLKVKRFFVFGDVKKPGHFALARNMTVLQAIAAAENYNETALLEEIRVIRGGDLEHPVILTADIARLFTYGDWSRNLSIEENDIIFVPRERLGDAAETARKLMPIVYVAVAPLYFATLAPIVAPGAFR